MAGQGQDLPKNGVATVPSLALPQKGASAVPLRQSTPGQGHRQFPTPHQVLPAGGSGFRTTRGSHPSRYSLPVRRVCASPRLTPRSPRVNSYVPAAATPSQGQSSLSSSVDGKASLPHYVSQHHRSSGTTASTAASTVVGTPVRRHYSGQSGAYTTGAGSITSQTGRLSPSASPAPSRVEAQYSDACRHSEERVRRLQLALSAEHSRTSELARLRSEAFNATAHVLQLEARLTAESDRTAKLYKDLARLAAKLQAAAAAPAPEQLPDTVEDLLQQQDQVTSPRSEYSAGTGASKETADLEVKLQSLFTSFKDLSAKLKKEEANSATLKKEIRAAEARHDGTLGDMRANIISLKRQLEEQAADYSAKMDMLREQLVREEAQSSALRKHLANADTQREEERSRLRKDLEATELERALLHDSFAKTKAELESLIEQANNGPSMVSDADSSGTDLTSELKRELQEVAAQRDSLQISLSEQKKQSDEYRERLAVAEAQLANIGILGGPHSHSNGSLGSLVARSSSSRPFRGGGRSGGSRAISCPVLFEAAAKGDLAAVQNVLNSEDVSADIVLKARDEQGRNLLHVLLMCEAPGAKDVLSFLLSEGQRWASRQHFMHSLQGVLWQREAYDFLCGCDVTGAGPLSILCRTRHGEPETAMSLLEAYADPMQRDNDGMTPFLESVRSANMELMQMLIQGTRGMVLQDADDAHRSALHWAAAGGHVKAIEVLLEARARVDVIDLNLKTPLVVAEEARHTEIATLLSQVNQEPDDLSEQDAYAEGMHPAEGTVEDALAARVAEVLLRRATGQS